MDHFFQANLFRPYVIPNSNLRLTSFQCPSAHSIPGMGLAINPTSVLVPMQGGQPLYSHTKALETIPEASPKVEVQSLPNTVKNLQEGFGNTSVSDEDSEQHDIDFENAKQKISEDVLNAFKSPVMRTAVVHFRPPEKKLKKDNISAVGRGASKVPKLKFE